MKSHREVAGPEAVKQTSKCVRACVHKSGGEVRDKLVGKWHSGRSPIRWGQNYTEKKKWGESRQAEAARLVLHALQRGSWGPSRGKQETCLVDVSASCQGRS